MNIIIAIFAIIGFFILAGYGFTIGSMLAKLITKEHNNEKRY